MDIDYDILRSLPQEQAMAYLREKLSGGIGQIGVTQQGSDVDPTLWGASGYDNGVTGNINPVGGGLYEAAISSQFDPSYAGGTYGNYTGVFDRDGKLVDVKFDKGERSGGWFSDNLETLGPLIVGGAMLGGATLGAGGLGGAGTAGAGGGTFSGATGTEALIGGTSADTLAGNSIYSLAQPGSSVTLGGSTTSLGGAGIGGGSLGTGLTTGGLGTSIGGGALGTGLIPGGAGAAALGAAAPAAAPTFLEKLLDKAGNKLLDKATDPIALGSLALTAMGSGGGGAQTATTGGGTAMTPEQQAYFNRPSQTWDWDKMQQAADAAGLTLPQYMARNWNRVSGGEFNRPVNRREGGVAYARGGSSALGQVARLMRGGGSGRADTIPARLSDGEYVMDAETVAMLGDGSTDEGARRLDAMRQQVRTHKGRAMAGGKFSPDAKSPLTYMKGRK